jgi:solute carrier family 8 (sodium/calcium exchanger)
MAGEDYKPIDEVVKFEKNEQLKSIFIDIVDDNEWEPDELFFVKIQLPQEDPNIVLGNIAICQITIINDDGTTIIIIYTYLNILSELLNFRRQHFIF